MYNSELEKVVKKVLSGESFALTTGQISRIILQAPRTVSRLIDDGIIKSFKVPESQDRRVPIEYFKDYLHNIGIPSTFLTNPGEDWSYRTSEAAKVSKSSQQTIIRCYDNGLVKGFRIPTIEEEDAIKKDKTKEKKGKDRRILHSSLLELIKTNGIPLDSLYYFLENKSNLRSRIAFRPQFTASFIVNNFIQLTQDKISYERMSYYMHNFKEEIPIEYIGRFVSQYRKSKADERNPNFTQLKEYLAESLK